MGGPVERPVPEDSAPEQGAAEVAPATIGTGSADSVQGVERHGMFGVAGSGDTSGFGGLIREPWVPPQAERPYGGYFDEIVDALHDAYAAGRARRSPRWSSTAASSPCTSPAST